MSIFQHRYSAFANKLATTCYSMSPVHKYYTNIAQILQDCTNKEHGTTEQHGTHWAHRSNWATNERCGKHTVLQVMAFVFIYSIDVELSEDLNFQPLWTKPSWVYYIKISSKWPSHTSSIDFIPKMTLKSFKNVFLRVLG